MDGGLLEGGVHSSRDQARRRRTRPRASLQPRARPSRARQAGAVPGSRASRSQRALLVRERQEVQEVPLAGGRDGRQRVDLVCGSERLNGIGEGPPVARGQSVSASDPPRQVSGRHLARRSARPSGVAARVRVRARAREAGPGRALPATGPLRRRPRLTFEGLKHLLAAMLTREVSIRQLLWLIFLVIENTSLSVHK